LEDVVDICFMTKNEAAEDQRACVFIHLETPPSDMAQSRGVEYVRALYDAWGGALPCYGIVIVQPTRGIEGIVCRCVIPRQEPVDEEEDSVRVELESLGLFDVGLAEERFPIVGSVATIACLEEKRKELSPKHEMFLENCRGFNFVNWLESALIYGSEFDLGQAASYRDSTWRSVMPELIYNVLREFQSMSREWSQEDVSPEYVFRQAQQWFAHEKKLGDEFINFLRRIGLEKVKVGGLDDFDRERLLTKEFICYLNRNGVEVTIDGEEILLQATR
jgi:hypothetical protein